jgi:thiamine kinase-like enzyme
VYSDLSLLRTEKHQRGVIDVMASESNLGPAVRWNTNEGIAHDFVHGRILEEKDMHTRRDVGEACAKVVAKFHSLETPPEFDRDGPLLWKWLERMLNQIESSENTAVLPVDVSELRAEVNRVSTVIRDDENACVVLAHGDLKPSNVILTQSDAPEVQLIDLELSGPNYRGFDLMKLFRTSPQQYSEERLRHFLKVYCDAMNVDDVARVEAETKLFFPVTWLEATVFFALVLVLEPQGSDDHEKWEALFLDRWRQYQENAKDLGL